MAGARRHRRDRCHPSGAASLDGAGNRDDRSDGRVPPSFSTPDGPKVRCTAHQFNAVPMNSRQKYVVVSAYYSGGITVAKFNDPSRPKEIGLYIPIEDGFGPDMCRYWYNGRIYASDFETRRGLSVYQLEGLGRDRTRLFAKRLNPQVQAGRFD